MPNVNGGRRDCQPHQHCSGTTGKNNARSDLLQGTLDLLILRSLQGHVLHGWAISERIQQISDNVLRVNQGPLYPALHRLEIRGWIKAEWGVSELGRRARFFRITPRGRRQLQIEHESWRKSRLAIRCWSGHRHE
ncbi:MAG: PadR family transcriptional regulator [Acidobacteriaceae bacterium]|nr:PadR family transcriptional regulator [Acidobacteriaceae bacterium]MBV9498667.1 PadR family transcriptional regulator [Acidobacteriaceae bacterium]